MMAWCEENGIDFIFGLPGNAVLTDAVEETADDIRTRRALDDKPCLRGFAETRYQAQSWNKQRRACARIKGTTPGAESTSSSPVSKPDRPSMFTRRSTVPAARPKT